MAAGIPAKRLWAYFLTVTRATLLAHLVLHTTYYVFSHPRLCVMFSRTFRRKILVITSTGRIVFETLSFESETLLSAETSVTTYPQRTLM